MDSTLGLRRCDSEILSVLGSLAWTVTRLHASPRGSFIITALKNGRIASFEMRRPGGGEPAGAWLAELEWLLATHAYDPAEATPPHLVRVVSEDVADIVPTPFTTNPECEALPRVSHQDGANDMPDQDSSSNRDRLIRNRDTFPIPYPPAARCRVTSAATARSDASDATHTESGYFPDSVSTAGAATNAGFFPCFHATNAGPHCSGEAFAGACASAGGERPRE